MQGHGRPNIWIDDLLQAGSDMGARKGVSPDGGDPFWFFGRRSSSEEGK
jgi:hypothetical protein